MNAISVQGDAIDFCLEQTVAHARRLPLHEAVRLLQGLLMLAGDCDRVIQLRETFTRLQDDDRQLELIASGQLRLSLTPSLK